MKHSLGRIHALSVYVAPLAGAWIETEINFGGLPPLFVAPLAGAWIETVRYKLTPKKWSVAPLAGAWIETHRFVKNSLIGSRRTPRGCVD